MHVCIYIYIYTHTHNNNYYHYDYYYFIYIYIKSARVGPAWNADSRLVDRPCSLSGELRGSKGRGFEHRST